MTDSLLGYGDF